MAKALVIVESPAKAKTINKYLGRDYKVIASMGHVRDLPKSKLGVDVDAGFEPDYVVIQTRAKFLGQMPADRFSFPIRVGRDVDLLGLLGGVLQFLQNFLAARNHFVRGLEVLIDIDAQFALGQISDMAHRSDDLVIATQILVDGFRLRWRLHHN